MLWGDLLKKVVSMRSDVVLIAVDRPNFGALDGSAPVTAEKIADQPASQFPKVSAAAKAPLHSTEVKKCKEFGSSVCGALGGEADSTRNPQSMQSLPRRHNENSAPAPPSSHIPSLL
jgi:hypothetical protein